MKIKLFNEFKKESDEMDVDFDPFSHIKKGTDEKIDKSKLLNISTSNMKLKYPFFSIPAGYTCPFAAMCKSLANKKGEKFSSTGKTIQDLGQFRCYSASSEVRYKNVRDSRWKNFDLLNKLKTVDEIKELLINSIDYYRKNKGMFSIFRIHESGDFYSQTYFDAWIEVAKHYPDVIFYAYTKSLPFWVKRLSSIPSNFKLIASVGGTSDELIDKYKLRYSTVVNNVEEAKKLKLKIDVDDTLAYKTNDNFALLLHGSQPEGTDISKQSYQNNKLLRKIKDESEIKENVSLKYKNSNLEKYIASNTDSKFTVKTDIDDDNSIYNIILDMSNGIYKYFTYTDKPNFEHDLEMLKK